MSFLLGGLLAGLGSFIGGNKAASAQRDASRIYAQQQAANRALLQPAIDTGNQARGVLSNALGLGGQDAQQQFYQQFQSDPGFQGTVDYGVQGLERSAFARGMGNSGNTAAGVGDYLQRNMYNAYQNRLSQLSALASGGQAQAGQLAGINTGLSGQMGGATANAGYYQGAGIQNAANAFANYGQQRAQAQGYQGVLSGYQNPGLGG